jgi:hypothetical protein
LHPRPTRYANNKLGRRCPARKMGDGGSRRIATVPKMGVTAVAAP